MNKKFNIGQVVYILSEKKESIVPGIVVEKIMIETLNGNSLSWKIKIGPEPNSKIIDSSNLREIYSSLEEVTEVLKTRLLEYVKGLALEANEKTKEWYGIESNLLVKNLSSQESLEPILQKPNSKEEVLNKLKQLVIADEAEETVEEYNSNE